MSRPYILVSNDDGVEAPGIKFLVETLRSVADLLVVAPDSPRSGFGCSITAMHPINYKILREDPGLKICSCSGTPTDCIKLALNVFTDRKPDLVVAGINHGDNSSVNVHYSGTMGAVTEGALQGYPAVAFSLCDHRENADFAPLRPYLIDFVFKAIAIGLPPFTCLNINFPAVKSLRECAYAAWPAAAGRMSWNTASTPTEETISGWWATVRNLSRRLRIPIAGRWPTVMWPLLRRSWM